jgi:hypothetical protein
VRAQANLGCRGTIEPSLSFSPEQRTRLNLFWEAGVEHSAIKNWDQADGGAHRRFMIRYVSGVMRDTVKRQAVLHG